MIDQIATLNEKLEQMVGVKLAIVPIERLILLDKNARLMKHEMFKNLVTNIERMGFQSFPFSWYDPAQGPDAGEGKYLVLSGNHRVKAAKETGKKELPTIFTDKPLSKDEQLAIQISHNAISGQDDPVLLKELFEAIQTVDMKYFAGLDDKALQELQKVKLDPLSEVRLDYRTLTFMFFPEEVQRLEETIKAAMQSTVAKDVLAARLKEFDRLIAALAAVNGANNVQNSAVAMMLILDVFESHLADLSAGWTARDPKEKVMPVPLASIFGSDSVPLQVGQKIKRAVDKLRDSGKVKTGELWKVLESWAEESLKN